MLDLIFITTQDTISPDAFPKEDMHCSTQEDVPRKRDQRLLGGAMGLKTSPRPGMAHYVLLALREGSSEDA